MEWLRDTVWPIIVVGGLGAFIDFLIGKTGQQKSKDLLLKWWVRFDDTRWNNFGREEGLFAGRLIDQCFGSKVWSFRRIAVAFALFNLFLLVGYFKFLILPKPEPDGCFICDRMFFYNYNGYYGAVPSQGIFVMTTWLIVSFIGFSVSVSFTKFVAVRMAYLCGIGEMKNFIIFFVMLIVNYAMLVFWLPAIALIKVVIMIIFVMVLYVNNLDAISSVWKQDMIPEIPHIFQENFLSLYPRMIAQFFLSGEPIDSFAVHALSFFPSLFWFVISIIFVSSFLLRPLVMRPISLVWARIVESEKPVFTLIFGGAAAFATAISEMAKHL